MKEKKKPGRKPQEYKTCKSAYDKRVEQLESKIRATKDPEQRKRLKNQLSSYHTRYKRCNELNDAKADVKAFEAGESFLLQHLKSRSNPREFSKIKKDLEDLKTEARMQQ